MNIKEPSFNMRDQYDDLKKLYKEAVAANAEIFIFQETEVLTEYAKYLLEHLNNTYKFEKT